MARKKLGKYEIIDRIGRGGMAEVYRGYHAALDRYVAIKLLHPFLADDPEFKDRFENEARNVAKLKHPNIVQVYDFEYDQEGDSYYMVMEMIDGPTLKDRLFDLSMTGERTSIAEAIRITQSSAEALAYAHQRNMIHRDVKPANLMLDEDDRVVLTDFGIAKIVTGAQFTASGGMVGTPAYMAPEQGLGEAGDERSDIYSLGVILYQLITTQLPFDADTPLAIILKHVNEPVPSPRAIVPNLSEAMEQIVLKTLAKEPENRYQTAVELAHDLSALDEHGLPRPVYDTQRLYRVPAPPLLPTDSRPSPPPEMLTSESEAAASTAPEPRAKGRLRPLGVMALLLAIIVLGIVSVAAFGGDDSPFVGLLGDDATETPLPTATEAMVAVAPTETPSPTVTSSPTHTIEPTIEPTVPVRASSTPRPTREGGTNLEPTVATVIPSETPTPTETLTPTPTETLTPTPTETPLPLPTLSPTPDLTQTAAYLFFEQQSRATATPNMTQTLSACVLEYIVVEPDDYNTPPSASDDRNPRLVRAGNEFEFEIVLRNTGTCAWPEGTRLAFNPDLTFEPDANVDLSRVESTCTSVPIDGINFATQQQSNFFLPGAVDLTTESAPLLFTGTAPDTLGCYYGVWDLFYPNSDIVIGRPLVLTIRAWGDAN